MNFTNQKNPFINIYREMLGRVYEQYLYHSGRKEYKVLQQLYLSQMPAKETSSIDDILTQDSTAVLDKVKNTALSIAYRIKLHTDFESQLDINWYIIRNELVAMDTLYTYRFRGSDRRRSALTTELVKLYKDRLDGKLECWRDLKDEMRYFIHLFHQYKQFKGEQRLLEQDE
ncbi:MAG: hypothetical protein AB1454_00025 [Candidatus Auribacterota bacterium]